MGLCLVDFSVVLEGSIPGRPSFKIWFGRLRHLNLLLVYTGKRKEAEHHADVQISCIVHRNILIPPSALASLCESMNFSCRLKLNGFGDICGFVSYKACADKRTIILPTVEGRLSNWTHITCHVFCPSLSDMLDNEHF